MLMYDRMLAGKPLEGKPTNALEKSLAGSIKFRAAGQL